MTILKIIVNNESPSPQTMFFFQEPPTYSGGPQVYSNSLGSSQIAAAPPVGQSQIQFVMDMQISAGVQSQPEPIVMGQANLESIVSVPIDLSAGSMGNDTTKMSVAQGLALSPPFNDPGVEKGAFRIVTPAFNPIQTPYNAGLAAMVGGEIVLSNFIVADPNQNIDVQPVAKFYVATGDFEAGTVFDFDSSSITAALCDATNGQEEFFVTYNVDGTWKVK